MGGPKWTRTATRRTTITVGQRCHEAHSSPILVEAAFPAPYASHGANHDLRKASWMPVSFAPRLLPHMIGLSIGGGVKAVASLLLMEPPSTLKGERRCLIPLLWVQDILYLLCSAIDSAIAAKEYVFQQHVERGVLDTFALD